MLGLLRRPPSLVWPAIRTRILRVADRARVGGVARSMAARRGAWPSGGLGTAEPRGRSLEVTPGIVGAARNLPGAREWTWALVELDRLPIDRSPKCRLVIRASADGRPSHDAVPMGGHVVVCESGRNIIHAVSRRNGTIEKSVQLPGSHKVRFPRGALHLGDSRCLVGAQNPATLYTVDFDAGRVEGEMQLPDDRGGAVWGIAAVPEGFGDPAGRLDPRRLADPRSRRPAWDHRWGAGSTRCRSPERCLSRGPFERIGSPTAVPQLSSYRPRSRPTPCPRPSSSRLSATRL